MTCFFFILIISFHLFDSIPHEPGSESLTLRHTQFRFFGGVRHRRTTAGQIFANILQILPLAAFLLWRSHGTLLCQVQTSSSIDVFILQVRYYSISGIKCYHESLPFVYEQTDFTKVNTAVYVFTYLYLSLSQKVKTREQVFLLLWVFTFLDLSLVNGLFCLKDWRFLWIKVTSQLFGLVPKGVTTHKS